MYRLIYEGSGSQIDKATFKSIIDAVDSAIDSSTDAPVEEVTVYKHQPQDQRMSVTLRVNAIPTLSDVETQLNQLDSHFSDLNSNYNTDFPTPSDSEAHRVVTQNA